MKTLAGSAIAGARRTYKHTDTNAPLRSNATLEAPQTWNAILDVMLKVRAAHGWKA